MLTALAVLHWNERCLPEQRSELYQSILGWLARSCEARPGRASPERAQRAERFFEEEEIDSGIVVRRGEHELRFWHLTFQEYLAARAIAGLAEQEQQRLLLGGTRPHLYQPEWREVFLLLGQVVRIDGQS